MNTTAPIVCVGEILWDALPEGLFLGGAPMNVCLNLQQLGVESVIVSRVGNDRLGAEALHRLRRWGVDTTFIQQDDDRETGFVEVSMEEGDPEYTFVKPVAWDYINLADEEVKELLYSASAVVFGSLAQRTNPNLLPLLELDCFKILDMNLRPPHYSRENVRQLMADADLVKMNNEELKQVQRWEEVSADGESLVRAVASQFDCSTVCVTRGDRGAVMLHKGKWFEHAAYPIEVIDAVGAGDAFLAALIYGLQSGKSPAALLPFANAAGAYVASKPGANPLYSLSDIGKMARFSDV